MEEHSETIIQAKTNWGCQHWAQSMAHQKKLGSIRGIFEVFGDVECLAKAGLWGDRDFLLRFGPTPAQACQISKTLFQYALHLAFHELCWAMRYSHSLPGLFASLTDKELVLATLVVLKKMFEVLMDLEEEMRTNPRMHALWQCLIWPACSWVREILIALFEAEFRCVPKDVLQELIEWSRLDKTNKRIEDSHNLCRDRCRHHKAGSGAAMGRFSALVGSDLHEDWEHADWTPDFDIEAVPTLPASTFKAAGNTSFSLGPAFWDTYMQGATELGTKSYLQSGLAWQRVMLCHPDWGRCERTWLSLMASPGDLIRSTVRDPPLQGLVIDSTIHGVIVVEVEFDRSNSWAIVDLKALASKGEFRQWCIYDPLDWVVL